MTSPDKPPYTVHIPGLTDAIRASMEAAAPAFREMAERLATGHHPYDPVPDVPARVCATCGKWPDHHVHTGDTAACGCNTCRQQRETLISVRKVGALLPVPVEALMDEGLIPNTRPPVRIPRRTRARRWIRSTVAGARLRAGSWIAGVDLDHECEY
jgi:hypothetical protein